MPDNDQATNVLLDEYEETADRLSRGEQVEPSAMMRYQGITGKLLASAMRKLWTARDLEEHIDKRIRRRCEDCEQRGSSTWRGILTAHAGKLIVCATVVVSLAIVFNRLDALRDFFSDLTPRVSQVAE